jgi:epoxyqueuosine reductase
VVTEEKTRIQGMVSAGELDPGLFRHELAAHQDPDRPRSGWNVVVVAVPRPAHRVVFALTRTERAEALLPPTYFRYTASFEDIRQDLAANGLPLARVEHLNGPHKAIAARLGLVRYGRNNIVYAPGIGSYLQLGVFWTDAKLPGRPAPDRPTLLPECAGCDRCRKACPTGAIGEDRVLLRAHLCLAYANQHPGVWPEWASRGPHRCLQGCLFCQLACPVNPALPIEDSGLSFSPTETTALLEAGENLPPAVRNSLRIKLAWLGRGHMETLLGRNLAALVRTLRAARSGEVRA